MQNNDSKYRKCVGALILNKKNKIFAARRIDKFENAWQMPQGGIDDNEDYEDALFREVKEETSISSIEIIAKYPKLLKYDIPDNLRPIFWSGKYRGQIQQWFLCKFIGNDSEININTAMAEFQEWAWQDSEFITANIVDFKRHIYQSLFTYWQNYL
ncbi:MAG: RNA pyrophosphohydrolase [Rickettsiales bacterium]|nr:RNA pyrophosphohydrolase [Rickettsiales bacterium]